MTVHLFAPPAGAARARVTTLELAELDRRVEAARREETLRQIRAAIRPRVLRAQRRQAVRRWLRSCGAWVMTRARGGDR